MGGPLCILEYQLAISDKHGTNSEWSVRPSRTLHSTSQGSPSAPAFPHTLMTSNRRIPHVLAAIIALPMLTSCIAGEMDDSITEAAAIARVEQLVRNTAASIAPEAKLELIRSSLAPNPCMYDDVGLPIKFTINRAYRLLGLDKTRLLPIAQKTIDYWEKQGHTIIGTNGFDVGKPTVSGQSNPDGYILA